MLNDVQKLTREKDALDGYSAAARIEACSVE
jgi:hypothetical protein